VPDFSQLRQYITAQAELGCDEVFLDDSWSLVHPQKLTAAKSHAAPVSLDTPIVSAPAVSASWTLPKTNPATPEDASPFEQSVTLVSFYETLQKDPLYVKSKKDLSTGIGKSNPRLLLVFYAPPDSEIQIGDFWQTEVGIMLGNLFESLHIGKEACFVTYFYKVPLTRALSPLIVPRLRKMLMKEVSLIQPATVLFFGELLLRQALEMPGSLLDVGGTPVQFADVPATALLDPYQMLKDKQLKLITWKTHIPRSGFFI
jgi:uracil-DNA glycosylase